MMGHDFSEQGLRIFLDKYGELESEYITREPRGRRRGVRERNEEKRELCREWGVSPREARQLWQRKRRG